MDKRHEISVALVVLLAFCLQIFINLGESSVQTSATAAQPTELIVVMYHSIVADESKSGAYVITPELLESDLKYLSEHGYESVSIRDLTDFQAGLTSLPEKSVLLTFDDGHFNNYTYAFPLLEKYGMCAVINVVGEYSEEFSAPDAVMSNVYSYLSWDNMKEMVESGRVEIGNHTYSLHNTASRQGANINYGESEAHYRTDVGADIGKLQDVLEEKLGSASACFAYPFGYYSPQSEALVQELGFAVTLSCEEGKNYIFPGEELYLLHRTNRPHGISSEKFFASYEE